MARHVHNGVGPQQHHPALTTVVTLKEHSPLAGKAYVHFGGFAPSVQVTPGEEILVANQSGVQNADSIVKIPLLVRWLD
jgi:hypothetical protein